MTSKEEEATALSMSTPAPGEAVTKMEDKPKQEEEQSGKADDTTSSSSPSSSPEEEQQPSSPSPKGVVSITEAESGIETTSVLQTRFRFYEPEVPLSARTAPKSSEAKAAATQNNNQEETTATSASREKELIAKARHFTFDYDDGGSDVIASSTNLGKSSSSATAAAHHPEADSSTADDILKSLQETEAQRSSLLGDYTSSVVVGKGTASTSSSMTSRGDRSRKSGKSSKSQPKRHISSNSNKSQASNNETPYEDAIKEALDVLRRHRSESASSKNKGQNNESSSTLPPSTVNVGGKDNIPKISPNTRKLRPRTPPEADKILQYREQDDNDDDDDDDGGDQQDTAFNKVMAAAADSPSAVAALEKYQEVKLKAQMRQERMAQYTSKLEEFKHNLHSETGEGLPSLENNDDHHQEQQLKLRPTATADSSAGVSELSQSTKTIEEEVQRGVERVLLAILEKANNTSRGRARPGEEFDGSSNSDNMESILRQALEGLSQSQSNSETNSTARSKALRLDQSKSIELSSSQSTARRSVHSVVEDLLAEETNGGEPRATIGYMASPASGMALIHSQTSWPGEEKKVPDQELVDQHDGEACTYDDYDKLADLVEDDQDYEADDGDEEDYDDQYEEGPSNLEGVLGPLNNKAGGTTGVVLDLQSHASSSSSSSTRSGPQNSRTSSNDESSFRSRSSSSTSSSSSESLSQSDPETLEDDADRGKESIELMKTLCAHLLPFGIGSKNLEEVIPAWDEENPNEAGYRIIRLSEGQLKNVEDAFEQMIESLKSKSENDLHGSDQYDDNFVRELLEAEKVLDDEERRVSAVKKAHAIVNASNTTKASKSPSFNQADHSDNDSMSSSISQIEIHPDFPGVKSAGKGEMGDLEYFHLPIIFKSHVTGFEPTKDLVLEPGNVIAGQYLVESELGSAAFSTAYRCVDLSTDSDENEGHEEVCLKVIKNTKDFFDQSLDEIKILEKLRQTGKCHENHIVEMKTFFYHREHLIICTELLRQNLFEFGKFIIDNNEEVYFTLPRLAKITLQMLKALKFVHSLGLVHSDVKPENILLGSYSRAQVKLIDFGSSCYLTDRQSSYIQSRSYRAPEVVLGLPYDGKIDVWSLGCVVAEMYTGEVTFQNDSIVSMLSRIEAICGPFPRHMIAQGRQSGRFFTKSGLLFEKLEEHDHDHSDEEEEEQALFDIFQPKSTCLSARLGFEPDLMDDFIDGDVQVEPFRSRREEKQVFVDFVARLLTIDPDSRLSAEEALEHPWMRYAATLSEDAVKYPSS